MSLRSKRGDEMAKSTSMKVTLKISGFILRLLMNAIFYILIIILVIYASKAAYKFAYQIYGPDAVDPVTNDREVLIKINKGDSAMDIASKLELNHAIKNKYSFTVKVALQGYKIMPGTYRIRSSMTYDEILNIITDYSASIVQQDPIIPAK